MAQHLPGPAGATPLSPTGRARMVKVATTAANTSDQALAPVAVRAFRAPTEVPARTVDRDYSAVLPPADRVPPPPRPARTLVLLGLAAVALVAVVTMALVYALSDPADPTAAGVGATRGVQTAAPATGPSGGSASEQPVQPTPDASGAPGVVGTPPGAPLDPSDVGLPAPGVTAVAAVVSRDVVEVSESVFWPDGAPEEIVLALPGLTLDGVPAGAAPSIRALQVSLDGTPVAPISGTDGDTWTVEWPDGSQPERMELRYLVDDAVVSSAPSRPGRARALIALLSQGSVGQLPVQVTVTGRGVLDVTCASSAVDAPSLCGRQHDDRWTATPAAGTPTVVIAELDLAPAG